MLYPPEVIEDIRAGNDIVAVVSGYVKLKQRGSEFLGLCPFHQEKTPSFYVSADKQLYHCFGCGAGGNVITFVMQQDNVNFPEAIRLLADRIHYSLPEAGDTEERARMAQEKDALVAIHKKAARFFYDCLQSGEGQTAAAYLDRRDVSRKTRIKFGLGYAPGGKQLFSCLSKEFAAELLVKSGLCGHGQNGYYDRFSKRLIFPIFDPTGRVIAFGGRILESGEPKYLNSPDTPIFDKSQTLYGIQWAKQSKERSLILVEGYMDVVTLFQSGFTQAVAALGTSLTARHAKLLRKYRENVVVLFDSDEPGTKAVLRSIPILLTAGLSAKILQVTGAKDPDEYIKANGSESFAALLSAAQTPISFQVEQLQKKYNLDQTEERVAFTNDAAKIIAKADSAIERDAYAREIASITNISLDAIASEVTRLSSETRFSENISDRQYVRFEIKGKEKGILEAKKSIVFYAATFSHVCRALRSVLQPDELGDTVYGKLLEFIYKQQKEIAPAVLVNLFESLEDQKLVSEIFSRTVGYEDQAALEKAVNDMLRVVKTSIADEKIPSANWEDLKKLVEIKRNIDQLYITITDG